MNTLPNKAEINTLETAELAIRRAGIVQNETVEGKQLLDICGFSYTDKNWGAVCDRQISRHELVENKDFYYSHINVGKGRPQKLVRFTINAANHVLLAAMTKEGKEARQDAINAKMQPNVVALPDFNDPVAAARAWADAKESEQNALARIEADRPKVEFVDRFVVASGLYGFRQVAKLLKANEHEFSEFLIVAKILYRLDGKLTAYQNHVDAGRFETRTGVNSKTGQSFTQCKFTSKGVEYVAGKWMVSRQIEI